jgi:hypothetical protein
MLGRTIWEKDLTRGMNEVSIPRGGVKNGIYILVVTSSNSERNTAKISL